jgi:hypothetical protein
MELLERILELSGISGKLNESYSINIISKKEVYPCDIIVANRERDGVYYTFHNVPRKVLNTLYRLKEQDIRKVFEIVGRYNKYIRKLFDEKKIKDTEYYLIRHSKENDVTNLNKDSDNEPEEKMTGEEFFKKWKEHQNAERRT